MLGGFILLGEAAGTYSMSAILSDPPSGTVVNWALVLVLLGALTKSAQVPFHSWLPRAMNAPTPVSAYLHSATMVKAGVYLVARFSPAFAEAGPWRPIVVGAGLASMLLGGYRALRQTDIKLVLAYGTISQLGFMMVLFGVGTKEATFAGCTLLIAHGIFKAALFMLVGVVDHQTHTRDLRLLDRLGTSWPVVAATGAVVAASMAGLPPLLGFIAKEEALYSLEKTGAGWGWIVLTGVVIGSVLTVAYSARFVWGAFGPAEDALRDGPAPDRRAGGTGRPGAVAGLHRSRGGAGGPDRRLRPVPGARRCHRRQCVRRALGRGTRAAPGVVARTQAGAAVLGGRDRSRRTVVRGPASGGDGSRRGCRDFRARRAATTAASRVCWRERTH